MTSFTYACPHCETPIEIDSRREGEILQCPRDGCGRAFKIEVPTAKVVPAGNDAGVAGSEKILMRVHPAMFRKHPLWFLFYVMMIVGGFLAALWWGSTSGSEPMGTLGFAALGILGVVLLGLWWIQVRFATLTVTTKRTIYRTGIISRNTSEVRHDDVRNLQMNQSVFERIFGVGDIAISSAGQSGLEIVAEAIPNPDGILESIRSHQH